jgi:homoserine dehydrogenase
VPLQFNEAYTEGISKLTTQDVEYAGELGYRIKHLGIAKKHDQGFELRVHPTLVPKDQMISNVDGVMNAVLVNGNAVGETLYYGAGAGAMATGSAVVADIIDIARLLDKDMVNIPYLGFMPKMQSEGKVIPINQIKSAFYLRMQAQDHPGVLAKVASIFSEQGINIESVMQKEREKKGDLIPLILLTHEVEESCIDKAIAQVEALDIIDGHIVKIRVEHFGR